MVDYLLVIDTECSALPKKWDAPYTQWDNWPYVVQVSWLVYDWEGTKIKQENHYIINADYQVSSDSREIHHISDALLAEKGEVRSVVLRLLQADLIHYKPIVIGHFVELDYHLLNVEFSRIGLLENPLMGLPLFCTMHCSSNLPYMDVNRQMKLVDLYRYLFSEEQPCPHNALYDAIATAKCFFQERELLSLTQKEIYNQKPFIKNSQFQRNTKRLGAIIVVAIFVLLAIVLYRVNR